MRKRSVLKALFLPSVLTAGYFLTACGGGGTSPANVKGVWMGAYTAGDGTTIPVCLELDQSGSSLSGKAYVAGTLYNVNFSGTVSGNTFSGNISGTSLSNQQVTVQFSGTVSANSLSGNVTVISGSNSYSFTLKLDKTTTSTCGWASQDVVQVFASFLGGVSSPEAGLALASVITSLPTVDVVVNGNQKNGWYVCIWELRDKVNATEYSIGAFVNPSLTEGAAFAAKAIGLDSNRNPQPVSSTLDLTGEGAVYMNKATNYSFSSDGADSYQNATGTTLSSSNPYYVSPCSNGVRYKAWMGEFDFSLSFDGSATGSGPNPGFFMAPPTGTKRIPSVYIEAEACP